MGILNTKTCLSSSFSAMFKDAWKREEGTDRTQEPRLLYQTPAVTTAIRENCRSQHF